MGEGCEASLALCVESGSETGGFGDEWEVSGCVFVVFVVVVDVSDVLVETDVEFPLVGQLALDGADASAQVEFAYGWVVGGEVEEHVEVEAVVGSWTFAEVEVVEVVAVVEVDVEKGYVAEESSFGVGVGGPDVVDVAVAGPDLEGVGHGLLTFAGVEGVDVEHFARDDAVESSDGIDEGAEKFAHHAFGSSLGVVEEDVGHAVGDFADGCSADACGEEVVVGRAVGFAEDFPGEGAGERIEEGNAVGESVLSGCIVEHAAVVGVGELVAGETVAVPHPSFGQVALDVVAGDSCPVAPLDVVVPSEDEGIDAEVFDECLEGWCLG